MKKIPVPNRMDYIASPYEPSEEGVMDVGYRTGKLSDGRGYRLECWRMDDLLMATVIFSDMGLSAYKRKDMLLLLELEDILAFNGNKYSVQCGPLQDDADNPMWAVNVMLANSKGTYAEVVGDLNRYII